MLPRRGCSAAAGPTWSRYRWRVVLKPAQLGFPKIGPKCQGASAEVFPHGHFARWSRTIRLAHMSNLRAEGSGCFSRNPGAGTIFQTGRMAGPSSTPATGVGACSLQTVWLSAETDGSVQAAKQPFLAYRVAHPVQGPASFPCATPCATWCSSTDEVRCSQPLSDQAAGPKTLLDFPTFMNQDSGAHQCRL
jgi:hypothetical protein